jgi:hypothetical protein
MRRKILLPLLAAVLVAACADQGMLTEPDAPRLSTNQAPVAVITVAHKKPWSQGGQFGLLYTFQGRNSYDPDGWITQYYWYPQAHCRLDGAYTESYQLFVPNGETCGLSLTVTDNQGATGWQVGYYSSPPM